MKRALRYLWQGFATTCAVLFFAAGVVVLLAGTALVCAAIAAWPGESPIRLPHEGEKAKPDVVVHGFGERMEYLAKHSWAGKMN